MRMKAQGEAAADELEQLRTEAQEKIDELDEHIAKLEGKIEAQTKTLAEQQQHFEEEREKMAEERQQMAELYEEAQSETELKRETSRKLKEEIIDNDRLTVANLNRIKHLETELDESRELNEKLDRENDELREELSKSIRDTDELERTREMLAEREAQLMSLTQRFADERMPSSHSSSHSFLGSSGSRRDSIFDRLGLSHKSEAISA